MQSNTRAKSRHTSLSRDKSTGRWCAKLGKKRTQSGKSDGHKFRFSADKRESERRKLRIQDFWDSLIETHGPDYLWDAEALAVAKVMAEGQNHVAFSMENIAPWESIRRKPYPYKIQACSYAERLSQIQSRFPSITVVPTPEDQPHLEEGQRLIEEYANKKIASGRRHLEKIDVDPTPSNSSTVAQALDAHENFIRKNYREHPDVEEGVEGDQLSPTGKNYLNRIADIRRHNGNAGQLDWPLSRLDFDSCQAMIDVWRSRPLKKDGTCPIASKQCREVIKRLTIRNGFFRWLHRTSEFDWRKPSDFDELDVSVKETAAEISAKASPMQVVSYTLDELAVLNEYATPHERLFLLCGLNCGFKRMEISTLRVCEIFLQQAHPYADTLDFKSNESDSFIKRLRKKSTVYGEWLLWPLTVKAMMWALNRRRQMTHILGGDGKGRAIPFRAESIVLLNDHGHPFTKTTKKGNSNNQITNTWNRLLDRIQKDHEEFRRLPHENLRDTSANLIRRNRDFGSEIAKVFISHGNPFSSDDLLELYSNKPFGRVFEACRWLQERFQPMFDATPDNPFPEERKLGGGGLTLKQKKVIRRLTEQGLPAKEIAKRVGCAAATIYRHWGKNGNGR